MNPDETSRILTEIQRISKETSKMPKNLVHHLRIPRETLETSENLENL